MSEPTSYRTLLPATSSRESQNTSQPPPPPTPPVPPPLPLQAHLPKRQTTATACEQCRRRKSKCDGGRPSCSTCIQRQLECSYEVEENETRRTSMKRKIEALEGELRPMSELYDLLRSRTEAEAQDILKRIRSSDDLDSVLGMIKDGDLVLEWLRDANSQQGASPAGSKARLKGGQDSTESELNGTPPSSRVSNQGKFARGFSSSSGEQSSRHRLSRVTEDSSVIPSDNGQPSTTAGLRPTKVDSMLKRDVLRTTMDESKPIYHGAALHWTTVTRDDFLISHLFDLYYTHQHPMLNFHDKDLFLEDFCAGRNNFCSSLLVNIMLANAARISSVIPKCNEPWNEENASVIFFKEAKKCLDIEDGKDSLTILQASLEFVYYYYCVGQDKMGDKHLYDSLRIANNLGLFRQNSSDTARSGSYEAKTEKVRSVTAWCVFDLMSINRLDMQLEPLVRRPPRFRIPYDGTTTLEMVLRKKFELSVIETEICIILYGSDAEQHPSPTQVEATYQKLLRWHESLPTKIFALDAMKDAHVIILLCRYQDAVISIFKTFTGAGSLSPDTQYYVDRAKSLSQQATEALRSLTPLFATQDYRCGYGYHYASSVALIAFSKNSTPTGLSSSVYHNLETCLKYLAHLGNYIYSSQIVLRVVQEAAETSEVPLPVEAWTLFKTFDSKGWVKQATEHVWSAYPAGAKAKWRGDGARIDELLKQWEHGMHVNDAQEKTK